MMGLRHPMLALVTCLCLCVVVLTWLYALRSQGTQRRLYPRPIDADEILPEEEERSPRIQHPYYFRECYTYTNLTARFTCTDSHSFKNYSYDNILECATNLWAFMRNKSAPNPWANSSSSPPPTASDAAAIAKRPSVHLVMAGDSHVRNIFEVFLRRIAGPRVKYHVAKMDPDDWKDSVDLFANWKTDAHEFFHELILLDGPLKITFYWDPFLEQLPQLMSSWAAGVESKPTHLLIGSTLHYMRRTSAVFLGKGQKAASMEFSNHLRTISPQLEKFSRITPVVFKLQDHLQKDPVNNIENPQNIDYYNRIANDLLPKSSSSSFVVWNSTVPLSDLYSKLCEEKGSVLPHTVDWRCEDPKHLGYLIIDQYLNMYLNDICCCFRNKDE
ncbi:uncharacterized protein LOC135203896 [Macrobrachium nipponense]|uniref:uncharacterized protein LOC135203896 n=1 Tax=Macrobrachium nipponense TaxID=159736 RepID=UPI0030C80677